MPGTRDRPSSQQVLDAAVLSTSIPRHARVLVAVSGGPDSVALLHTLQRLASHPERRWSLRIGHVNHLLRGEESDEDERFVRALGAEQSLGVDLARVQTGEHAKSHGVTIEVAARELRAQALTDMVRSWPGDVIATGHTQDDQAETLLLRLLRGTGLGGLGGIRPRREPLIRPFLGVRHEVILEALGESGLQYRLDSSNRDLRYRRNQVRDEVVPVLARLQRRVVEVLGRTASLLQTDYDYLRREAERAISCLDVQRGKQEISAAVGPWRALHPALRRLTARLLIERLLGDTRDIDEEHVALVCAALERSDEGPLESRLPRGLTLILKRGRFALRCGITPASSPIARRELTVPGAVDLEVGTLRADLWTISSAEEVDRLVTVCGPFHALCDADRVGPVLAVRGRQPGDRMRPLGAPGSRKLQDIMVDRRIPRALRERLPVVESDRHVMWVPGLALDERVAIGSHTARILHLQLEPTGWRAVIECLSQVDL